jgi:hypothetical protein
MDYEDALKIGRARAENAARVLQRWAGVKATAVCSVRPLPGGDPDNARDWEPIGTGCWKEICRHTGALGHGEYHLLVVDETGSVKACSRERFDLQKALELASRLPLPVAEPGTGELWLAMEGVENAREARSRVLYADA